MSERIDEVTDLFVAQVTGRRAGLSAVELNELLRTSIADLARDSEDEKSLQRLLIGQLVQHFSEALDLIDRLYGKPVSQNWIGAVVEVAADARAGG